jgi:hypothetical protein
MECTTFEMMIWPVSVTTVGGLVGCWLVGLVLGWCKRLAAILFGLPAEDESVQEPVTTAWDPEWAGSDLADVPSRTGRFDRMYRSQHFA